MSKKDDKFNELINHQPAEIKDWIVKTDHLLMNSGCKAAVDAKGNFTYTSKHNKKIICRITMTETGCSVRPNTNNAVDLSNMAMLPESMLNIMRSTRGCGGCAKKNPNFVACKHGGPYQFSHNNEKFESCRFVGFNFTLENEAVRDVLEIWIKNEL